MSVTIHDIARKARVSIATVSRVVNRSPLVNSKTKEKVLKIINDMNYQPNLMARGLSMNISQTLGLVAPSGIHIFNSEYFTGILDGVESATRENEYDLLLEVSNPNNADSDYYRSWLMRKCDGLIIIAPLLNDLKIKNLETAKAPAVLVNSISKTLSYVDSDNVTGAFNAVEYLISLGHRRIAIINGTGDNLNSRDRFKGYKKALKKNNIPFDPELSTYGGFNKEDSGNAAEKLINLKNPPTAIFASNDSMALGAIFSIKKNGLKVPENISVIGYDDTNMAMMSDPPLTTVKQDLNRLSREAVRILIDLVKSKKHTQKKVLVDTELVIRKSCSKINQN